MIQTGVVVQDVSNIAEQDYAKGVDKHDLVRDTSIVEIQNMKPVVMDGEEIFPPQFPGQK